MTFAGSNGTRLTNVAAGEISATSTDAVTGAQLNATNGQLAANTTVINALRNGTEGYVQVLHQARGDGREQPCGRRGGHRPGNAGASPRREQRGGRPWFCRGPGGQPPVGGAGAERQITNVADGTSATDAANMRQLMGATDSGVLAANAYTDGRFQEVNWNILNLRRDAEGGTAAAMALSAIPQPIAAGRSMVGFGTGVWQGQTAMAMGFSRASDDGRLILKAGATYNSRSQGGANAGFGLAF